MDLTSAFSSVIALSPIALPDIIIYPYPPTLPWLPMHTSIISSEVQYCGPPYSTKGYSDHFYTSPSYSDHELHNNKRFRNSYPKHGETPCQHSHSQGTALHEKENRKQQQFRQIPLVQGNILSSLHTTQQNKQRGCFVRESAKHRRKFSPSARRSINIMTYVIVYYQHERACLDAVSV